MFPPAGQSFEAAADLSGTGPSPTPADAKRDPLRCCWRPLGSLSLSCSHEWSLPLDTQHHEAGICRRNHYCHPTSLLRRSWFEGGQRGQKEPAQHSDEIFAFSPVQTRMSQKGAAQGFSLSPVHPQHHEWEKQRQKGADQ